MTLALAMGWDNFAGIIIAVAYPALNLNTARPHTSALAATAATGSLHLIGLPRLIYRARCPRVDCH